MKNMTSGNPTSLILGFAVPLLIGNIFQQVYNFVDVIIVGRYLGEEALAGVGSTGNLTFFLLSLIMGLCNGAGIIIAQCFGAQDYKRMRRAVTAIIWVAGVLTILVSVLGVCLNEFFLRLLSVPENVIPYSKEYLHIIYLFVAGSVIYNGCSAVLRSFGDSKTPVYALTLGSVLNIVLDLLFVIKFQMGVSGVAYATVISQHASAVVCLVPLLCKGREFELSGLTLKPDKDMVALIFKTGVPTAFQSCLISIGGMSVQRLINSFGAAVMAAYAAAGKIDAIAIQVILSLGTALSVFTGQNMGQNQFDRIREGLHKTLLMTGIASVAIAVGAFVFGEELMRLFLGGVDSEEVVLIGATYLSIMGVAYIICGIMQSYQNVLRGAGDVNVCVVAGMTELAGRVIFAYLLASLIGVTGIWIATPLSWGCGCIVPVVRYYTGKWKGKSLV
ncbi:MAG: MATE family efflux transporter [Lachnospiraceae bacterium]|nr:MATE family efflux transporter [Lachnospiraceae bacterium]